MSEEATRTEGAPDWVLAFGPFLVIGVLVVVAFTAMSLFEFEWLAASGTVDILVLLTVIGFIAGILPVIVGMLWFPYVRRLEDAWIHAVLAFSAGVLAFIAFEMGGEAVELGLEVPASVFGTLGAPGSVPYGVIVAGVAAVLTVVAMEAASRWRKRQTATTSGDGLRVAYLVAIGLGLHSVGEGLAIGTAFILGESGLVVLLAVGFILHNVTEGPTIIAAIARDSKSPPLLHFGALGLIAGGGVIVGGWLGSIVDSPLVAAICFAIAFGAILQVLWEMVGLIRRDAGDLFTRRIAAAFVVGAVVMFLLEEIVVGAWLLA